jgi:hypothetical protein
MARGSSGRAARRGGRVAVPTKRALQSGVTDDTSNKKQAVGGGGAGPSSAPVSLTPAEGAPADGQQLDVRMIATVAVIQWFIMIAHVLAAVPTDRCALISTLYEQLRPQKKRFYYTRRGGLIYPQGSHWRSLCARRDERSFMHFLGVDPNITGPSGDDLPGILEIRSPRPSEESDGRGWRSDSVSCRRKAVAAEATRAPTLSALLAENAATQSANIDRIVDAVNNASNNLVGTLEKLFGGHRGQGAGSGAGSRTE